MKILACALLSLTAATASAQVLTVPPPAITYDRAVANERNLFVADQNHDLDTVRRIVADDFVDIAKDGSSIGKDALLKEIPTLTLLKHSQQNFRLVVLGPYAYSISYDSDATLIDASGKTTRSQNALNSVWILRDGRWQILLHTRGEATPVRGR